MSNYLNMAVEKASVLSVDRSAIILSFFYKKRVSVYNGKKFIIFSIKKAMIGKKFGEFSITKLLGSHISKKKKNKKKNKKK